MIKDKLLQVKISTEFYTRITNYCQKYSASISAGVTSLIRRQLEEDEKKGALTDIKLPANLMAEIERFKDPSDRFSDYVERVMWWHIQYKNKTEKSKNENTYYDTKYENRDSINQDTEENDAIVEFRRERESKLKNQK